MSTENLKSNIGLVDERIREVKKNLAGLIKLRQEYIRTLLKDIGVEEDMVYYYGTKKMIIVKISSMFDDIRITLAPIKKDGSPSKQNRCCFRWDEIVREWEAQKDDPEKYAADLKAKHEKQLADFRKRIEAGEDVL